jgi:hypothetical protein
VRCRLDVQGSALLETQAKELEKVAQIDGMPMTEAIREAVAAHIESRRRDPDFQSRIERILEEDQAILRRLVG